jgi:hypothetical protein
VTVDSTLTALYAKPPILFERAESDVGENVLRQPRFETIEAHAVDARLARSPYYFDANQG